MLIKDQTGREIHLRDSASRIVSLVPSQTELLYSLGLDSEVKGITKFCVHPEEWLKTKTIVGGTKKINPEIIRNIKPDLIIANKEENSESDIRNLMVDYPTWISDVKTFDESLKMIAALGQMTGRHNESEKIIEDIRTGFNELFNFIHQRNYPKLRICYLIWNKPLMAAGRDTFISDMINRCGWENAIDLPDRYPELSEKYLNDINADLIILSSEPFPFGEKHLTEFRKRFPTKATILADGEMFSWYGSRMKVSCKYFQNIISESNELLKFTPKSN
ncbi:MAG: cobalamin-binding protein [Bacteroidetes bacterium]|nr:MAG: cobalamin-binding protein [Bacteroidota bacterium]REK32205.1 MAG: cobalamin-binding protein [Bacteroidota bacterium]REK47357.1 MAG: cobalamin-binding protein [Bacteroidota bacterium]